MQIEHPALIEAIIARIGVARLVDSPHALLRDQDEGRRLYQIVLPGRATITVVQVTCPSSGRHHLLRVPPEILTCGAAVAWTFGMDMGSYRPAVES